MPGFDGTGPFGSGPVGRGRGPCGRGIGFRGFGYRAVPGASVELSKEERIKILKAQKENIEKVLKEIES